MKTTFPFSTIRFPFQFQSSCRGFHEWLSMDRFSGCHVLHFGQICSGGGRRGGGGAHLEVGTVPQQVPRAPMLCMVTLNSRDAGARMLVSNTVIGSAAGQGPQALRAALSYIIQPGSGLDFSWMRKGDSHLELLIYLAPILPRQSPGGVPCRGRHRAPWPAVLPRFWPWQRSPLCCLTRNSPGFYQVCDLSMCGSLTRASATLGLGRGWNTPVYPLIVRPSVGREGGGRGGGGRGVTLGWGEGEGGGNTWKGGG